MHGTLLVEGVLPMMRLYGENMVCTSCGATDKHNVKSHSLTVGFRALLPVGNPEILG
jgi:hypothetical protein